MSTPETERSDGNGYDDELDLELEVEAVDDLDAEDTEDVEDIDADVSDEAEAPAPGEKAHFDADEPLLSDAESYRARWLAIQTGFVDEPLYAVESAGRLLTEVLGDLASTFAQKRAALEREWRHGGDTSTDDLRAAFKNYRAFFNRVVST